MVPNPLQDGNCQSLDFQKYGTVLKRIPKGSRPKTAKALTQILEDIINKNDHPSWRKLFQFGSQTEAKTVKAKM